MRLKIVEPRRPNTSSLLRFSEYDLFIVSFSSGKDSLACVLSLLEQGVPRHKIELWHQHVDGEPGRSGLMDWPVTEAYSKAVAKALDLPLRSQWKHGGFEREMLRSNALTAPVSFELREGGIGTAGGKRGNQSTRMKFPQVSPDLSVRWCSAYLKIDVAAMAISNDPSLRNARICFISGERRQESAARSRYAEIEAHRTTSSRRRVDHWRLPIDWDETAVWNIIRRWNIQPHPAYRIGFSRVSCLNCIFANPDQWATIKLIATKKFKQIAGYESVFGLTIQRNESVLEQADRGTPFPGAHDDHLATLSMSMEYNEPVIVSDWKLPIGAYKGQPGPS